MDAGPGRLIHPAPSVVARICGGHARSGSADAATWAAAPTHERTAPMARVVGRSGAFCVIGAGPAGLTAAKNLLAVGVDVDVLEREPDLGGNWHYGQSS